MSRPLRTSRQGRRGMLINFQARKNHGRFLLRDLGGRSSCGAVFPGLRLGRSLAHLNGLAQQGMCFDETKAGHFDHPQADLDSAKAGVGVNCVCQSAKWGWITSFLTKCTNRMISQSWTSRVFGSARPRRPRHVLLTRTLTGLCNGAKISGFPRDVA